MLIDIPLWSEEEQTAYIKERVAAHRHAEMLHDIGSPIPECSMEERWGTEDKWAVKKKDGKRALKLFSSEEEAKAMVDQKPELVIEYRAGGDLRCEENFCRVAEWCEQYAKKKGAGQKTDPK